MHCPSKHRNILDDTMNVMHITSNKESSGALALVLFPGSVYLCENMLDCLCWLLVLSRDQGLMRKNKTIHVIGLYWACCMLQCLRGMDCLVNI